MGSGDEAGARLAARFCARACRGRPSESHRRGERDRRRRGQRLAEPAGNGATCDCAWPRATPSVPAERLVREVTALTPAVPPGAGRAQLGRDARHAVVPVAARASAIHRSSQRDRTGHHSCAAESRQRRVAPSSGQRGANRNDAGSDRCSAGTHTRSLHGALPHRPERADSNRGDGPSRDPTNDFNHGDTDAPSSSDVRCSSPSSPPALRPARSRRRASTRPTSRSRSSSRSPPAAPPTCWRARSARR